jgi:hypothetical protein
MGLQAKCTASFEGKVSAGNVVLESEELIFRGNYRVVILFKAIIRLSEGSGKLSIETDEGTLILDLGGDAKKWEEKIKNPKSLLDRLGLKNGMSVTLQDVDDPAFLKELKQRKIKSNAKFSDLIFLQADSIKELQSVRNLAKRLEKNGALWIVYPKGKKDLRQEDIFKAGKSAGLVDVKVVSFSSTHTALKFVIPLSKR